MQVDAISFTSTVDLFMESLEDLNSLETHKSCIMNISEDRKRNLKLLSGVGTK